MLKQSEAREHKVLEALRNKVATINGIIADAEKLRPEDPVEERMQQLFGRTLAGFPADSQAAYKEYRGLQERDAALRERLDSLDQESEEAQGIDDEMMSYIEREIELMNNPNVQLLHTLHSLGRNLLSKHAQVLEYGSDIGKMVTALHRYGFGISAEDIVSVRTEDAWGIVLTLEENWFAKNKPDSRGFHIRRTPFSVIRGGITGAEGTVRHEQLHNVTEHLVIAEDPNRAFTTQLAKYNVLKSTGENPHDLHRLQELFEPKEYIDYCHGEMISSAEQAFFENFDDGMESEERLLRAIFKVPVTEYERYAKSFRSAGWLMNRLLLKTATTRASNMDEELKGRLARFEAGLKSEFTSACRNIERAFNTIDSLSGKKRETAQDELLITLGLLNPSQYRHLPSYAEYLTKIP